MVKLADVVVVVGGETGTPQIVGAAQILEKPIVPLPFAGGVAYQMFDKWDEEVAPTHSKATAVKPSWQGQKDLGEWDQLGCDASEVAERIVQAATVSCFLSQPHHEFGADVSAAVRRVAREVGFSVEEQLDAPTSGSLYDDLDRRIGRSIVTIAIVHDQRYRSAADRDDLSVNPNVLFELGLAAGLGHKLVVVSRTGQNVPFDIKQYRRIEWPAVVTQQAESVREQRVLRFEGQLRDLLRHAREVRRNRPRE